MIDFSVDFITGVMMGMEFPPAKEIDEDMKFIAIVDILILRFTLVVWKSE